MPIRPGPRSPSQAGDFSALPPAVVMDVDESVLDNSESEVRLLLKGTCFEAFPASWDAWVAERKAPAVPGAVEFIQSARMLKDPAGRAVRVFFVTNRECGKRPASDAACPQEEDTAANLRSLGLGTDALQDELLVRGERPDWDGEKLSRRQEIARGYRIVLNIGDDLADFLPEVRRQTVARARPRALRAAMTSGDAAGSCSRTRSTVPGSSRPGPTSRSPWPPNRTSCRPAPRP